MLSNPPIPHLGREFNDEATEVENYEVRLVLYHYMVTVQPSRGLTLPHQSTCLLQTKYLVPGFK